MSVSRGCKVIERHPGKWFCVVAADEYDYDFRGSYWLYGPKPTADAAYDEMRRHEPNPGGHTNFHYDKLTPENAAMIDDELARKKKFNY